jgi:hypothetical protein
MIELLFVIVILGIVGGIALEAVRQYYDGVYKTITTTKRVIEADHILDQLTKYFENGISVSIVNIDKNALNEGTCKIPIQGDDSDDYTIEFIGVDVDSLRGTGVQAGWSEETQLLTGNELNISDANLTMAGNIIHALDQYSLANLTSYAIYNADSVDVNACTRFDANGTLSGNAVGFHKITASTSTTLTLDTLNSASHGHKKYLLRTGYAFRAISNPGQPDDGNFVMYSNFRPWLGERYNTAPYVKVSTLGRNVAHFYADYNATDFQNNQGVSDRGLVWRLKVCMRGFDNDLTDTDENATQICRERRVHVRY